MFVKKVFAILTESEDVAFNKQKELDVFGQKIWLKLVLVIEVVIPDKRKRGELIFSKTELLMLIIPELRVKMNFPEEISLI